MLRARLFSLVCVRNAGTVEKKEKRNRERKRTQSRPATINFHRFLFSSLFSFLNFNPREPTRCSLIRILALLFPITLMLSEWRNCRSFSLPWRDPWLIFQHFVQTKVKLYTLSPWRRHTARNSRHEFTDPRISYDHSMTQPSFSSRYREHARRIEKS